MNVTKKIIHTSLKKKDSIRLMKSLTKTNTEKQFLVAHYKKYKFGIWKRSKNLRITCFFSFKKIMLIKKYNFCHNDKSTH